MTWLSFGLKRISSACLFNRTGHFQRRLTRAGSCHLFIFSLSFILGLFSLTAPILAHDTGCYRLPSSRGELICPPPFGGLMPDINGSIACGPGFCARNSYGQVKCSSMPGGSADMDDKGNVVCVGGCVDGATSYCASPRP